MTTPDDPSRRTSSLGCRLLCLQPPQPWRDSLAPRPASEMIRESAPPSRPPLEQGPREDSPWLLRHGQRLQLRAAVRQHRRPSCLPLCALSGCSHELSGLRRSEADSSVALDLLPGRLMVASEEELVPPPGPHFKSRVRPLHRLGRAMQRGLGAVRGTARSPCDLAWRAADPCQ